jgi:PAS domain S-box-containing protein
MQNKITENLIKEIIDQGIIDAIGDAVSIQDTDYKILYQNQTAKDLIGEHVGEYCYSAYEKRGSTCEACPLAKSLKDGNVHKGERINTARSEEFFIEITASAIKDPAGKIIGGIVIVRDITEHKRDEEKLRNYVKRLSVLNEINSGIAAENTNEKIAETALNYMCQLIHFYRASLVEFDRKANKAAVIAAVTQGETAIEAGTSLSLEEFGVSEELKKGRIYVVDDIMSLSRRSEVDERLLSEGVRSYVNIPLLNKGLLVGSLNIGSDTAGPFDPEHIDVAYEVADLLAVGFLQNRHRQEILESERKYRHIVDNALVGVYKTDLQGNILYVNSALIRMLEFESSEEMRSVNVKSLYKDQNIRDILIAELNKKGKVENFSFKALTKRKKTRSMLLSAYLYKDELSGMIIDITGRKVIEEQLKERVEELEKFYEMAVGREVRMKELKSRIKELELELLTHEKE